MSEKTIVVVGGAMAGPVAAARAREIDEKARIILLERNSRVSYAAGSLGLYLSGEVTSLEDLNREKAEFFRDVYNIEAWTHTNVTAINAGQHTIQIDRSGDAQTLHYNSLVYALGAESIVPDNISSDLENVALFRTLNDLEKIERNLNQGQRVCVIGSGPFGLEAAGALVRRGATVTVLEKESRLYPEADSFISAAVQLTLESKARIVTGAQVESYRVEGARVRSLVLNDKTEIETDLVILAAGILPRTALLQKAGANLTEQQTIRVDTNCRTNLPDIYACGVCVSLPQVLTGEPIWIPQVASADKSAQVAGANAAGLNLKLPPVCGTLLLRVLDQHVGFTGLSRKIADAKFGSAVRSVMIIAPDRESFLPDAGHITVQMQFDNANGRVIGVAMSGRNGVDKRLDVAATAIAGGLTVEQLALLDLSYAPACNGTRDPLNVAATVAAMERSGFCRAMSAESFLNADHSGATCLDVSSGSVTEIPRGMRKLHVPLEELRKRMSELDDIQDDIVVLSEYGRRGYLATRILSGSQKKNVRFLAGGATGLNGMSGIVS